MIINHVEPAPAWSVLIKSKTVINRIDNLKVVKIKLWWFGGMYLWIESSKSGRTQWCTDWRMRIRIKTYGSLYCSLEVCVFKHRPAWIMLSYTRVTRSPEIKVQQLPGSIIKRSTVSRAVTSLLADFWIHINAKQITPEKKYISRKMWNPVGFFHPSSDLSAPTAACTNNHLSINTLRLCSHHTTGERMRRVMSPTDPRAAVEVQANAQVDI